MVSAGEQARRTGRACAPATWALNHKARGPQGGAHPQRALSIFTSIFTALLAVVTGVSALAACAPAQTGTAAPTATAQASATVAPSPTATPRLVYQADWSHGLAGWSATPGWSVAGGALQTDTGTDREITLPFQPTTSDYAVEFHAQVLSTAQSNSVAKQFELSADPAGGTDGYIALFDHITLTYTLFPSHPHEVVYIDPMLDQEPDPYDIHDYEPTTHDLIYRVEVRGSRVTLLIGGHFASWAHSTKTPRLATGPLHFYCTGVQLKMSDLKVYTL